MIYLIALSSSTWGVTAHYLVVLPSTLSLGYSRLKPTVSYMLCGFGQESHLLLLHFCRGTWVVAVLVTVLLL